MEHILFLFLRWLLEPESSFTLPSKI